MPGFEMPDDGDKVQDNKPADDPISRAISETLGEKDSEDSGTESGNEGTEPKDGQQQQDAGQGGNSDNKDNNKEQTADVKGKKDEKQAGAANGDLTLSDGTVVKGGAERRHYEARKLAEQQLSMRSNELQQANASRERIQNEYNQLKQTVQQLHGADPVQVATGLRLVRDLTRDPAGTLRTLLTEAIGAGYTVEGIGQGIDAASIRQSLEQKLQPFIDAQQQQQEQQQTQQQVEQEVQQFFAQHPDAVIHDALIAAVIQKDPSLSMSEAYYQLRSSAIDRGLDWSQPLVPQIKASEQQQQNNQQQQQQKPMPNGRAPANADQAQTADKIAVAHESTDMGSIVKQAMRESGLNI